MITEPVYMAMTREQFFFTEMREFVRLKLEGLSSTDIIAKITDENLYQFSSRETTKNVAKVCDKRIEALDDPALERAIVEKLASEAKQICLYSIMLQNRTFYDFMVSVIGEKYRNLDLSYSKQDINVFFFRMQQQIPAIEQWSDETIERTKRSIRHILSETGYFNPNDPSMLAYMWICPDLEIAIKRKGDMAALSAFNCFS